MWPKKVSTWRLWAQLWRHPTLRQNSNQDWIYWEQWRRSTFGLDIHLGNRFSKARALIGWGPCSKSGEKYHEWRHGKSEHFRGEFVSLEMAIQLLILWKLNFLKGVKQHCLCFYPVLETCCDAVLEHSALPRFLWTLSRVLPRHTM